MQKVQNISRDLKILDEIVSAYSTWATFNTEEQFYNYFVSIRWAYGKMCPRCFCCGCYNVKNKKLPYLKCADCYYNFTAFSGTIFKNNKLPIKTVFNLIYEILKNNNYNSCALARQFNLTQKTTWRWVYALIGARNRSGVTKKEEEKIIRMVQKYSERQQKILKQLQLTHLIK